MLHNEKEAKTGMAVETMAIERDILNTCSCCTSFQFTHIGEKVGNKLAYFVAKKC